jgi:hypothetical protein
MVAILRGVRWNLGVALICVSFMAKDREHFLQTGYFVKNTHDLYTCIAISIFVGFNF